MEKRHLCTYISSPTLTTWTIVILLCGGLLACSSRESDGTPTTAGDDVEPRPETEIALRPAESTGARSNSEMNIPEDLIKTDSTAVVAKDHPAWETIQRNWPTFRGPGANGVAHFTNAPISWDVEDGTGIRWKVKVPLAGTNSPVVWGNHLFLSGANEEVREVYCFDTETGNLRWTRTVGPFEGTPQESPSVAEDTGYAAPTMAVKLGQAFAIFANGDIVAFDFEGNLLWGYNRGAFNNHYGHSSSLMAFDELLFVQADQISGGKLTALHTTTGDEAWTSERDRISWASPIIARTPTGEQLILTSEVNVDAYEPSTGKLIWSQECLGGEVGPSPAYSDGLVFAANEFAVASAIRLSESDGEIRSEVVWEYDEILPEVSSPVGNDERFYFATSVGELVCLDANTGDEYWLEELSDSFYSSPILVGDRLYILDMEGKMFIVRASAEFDLIASPTVGEPTLATPAYLDGRIYIRTADHLYCIEK